MLRTPQVGSPSGAQAAFGRVAPGFGWFGLGALAEVHLVARLKNVRAILEKTLETIGEHPEILRILARSLSQVVRETLEGSLGTLDSALEA